MTRVFQGCRISWIAGFAVGCVVTAAAGAPPKVVQTVPADGAQDVAPGLRELRVTFDQNMARDGYSICTGPSSPKFVGKPRWVSARVLVLTLKLDPDADYSLSINCPAAQNFRSVAGEPVEPYPISFHTAAAKGAASRPADRAANAVAIRELRRAIDEDYSYRDLHKLNWDELFTRYRATMEGARSPRAFADAAAKLLANAKDMHIWLKVGDETIGSFRRSVAPNCDLQTLAKAVPGWRQRSSCVYTGRFDDGIGYILITTWLRSDNNPHQAAIDALNEFSDTKGLIVDVRPNAGGAEPLAQEFAGHFISKPAVYAKHVARDHSAPKGFSPVRERQITPAKEGPKYHGKVAVLTGRAIMSSCESFLLMMKQVPGCKLVGEKSFGSSGNPRPYELGNDVVVYLPSWKDLRPDGTCFEGEGIAPDIAVSYSRDGRSDAVLEAARKLLHGQ